jgi:thiol-disulfide isomerase/thioredoxin
MGPIACVALTVCLTMAPTVPPIFLDKPPTGEFLSGLDPELFVLIDATSKNCPPCRQMDRTTWVDARVEAWVSEHGFAVRLDVDLERMLSRHYRIEAMPTVIVMRGGKELDRATGYQSADDLLAWLADVKAGKTRLDGVRAKAGSRDGPRVDIQARFQLAQELARSGRLDEATGEFVWLWKNMLAHDPAFAGVRTSFMADAMGRLAENHPPAKKAFELLRVEAETGRDRDDWIVLNEVVGDTNATLLWFDRAVKDPAQLPAIRRSGFRLDSLLIAARRWADVAVLFEDPLDEVHQAHQQLEMMKKFGTSADMEDVSLQMFHGKVALVHAALLAAHRDAEAKAVAAAAYKLRDSPKLREAIAAKAREALGK